MNEQLSLDELGLRPAALPPVMRWRKLLVHSSPVGGTVSTVAFRAVGAVLANHADRQGGSCWPSIATIAAEAGVSRRTALYATAALEEAELLYRRRRGRTSTSYLLLLPDPVENAVEQAARSASRDGSKCKPLHPRSALRTEDLVVARGQAVDSG